MPPSAIISRVISGWSGIRHPRPEGHQFVEPAHRPSGGAGDAAQEPDPEQRVPESKIITLQRGLTPRVATGLTAPAWGCTGIIPRDPHPANLLQGSFYRRARRGPP